MPANIQIAITEALEEKEVIAEESQTRVWSEVLLTLKGVAKQRFFDRVINKLPSDLQALAFIAPQLNRNVRDHHIKYENLDKCLIQLNYFFGQQLDLQKYSSSNDHLFQLPQSAPDRSAFYNFLADFGEN